MIDDFYVSPVTDIVEVAFDTDEPGQVVVTYRSDTPGEHVAHLVWHDDGTIDLVYSTEGRDRASWQAGIL